MTRWIVRSAEKFRSRKGMASALIIMLLVLLIFFGVLALVTSAADLRLSRKRAEWNQEYYHADAEAIGMLAELDGFCSTLDGDNTQSRLESWLKNRQNLHDWSVEASAEYEGAYYLTALVVRDKTEGQGIAVRLMIRTDVMAVEDRITIEAWSQWQPAFEYGGSGGGVWEG